jgi:hypothetical protein
LELGQELGELGLGLRLGVRVGRAYALVVDVAGRAGFMFAGDAGWLVLAWVGLGGEGDGGGAGVKGGGCGCGLGFGGVHFGLFCGDCVAILLMVFVFLARLLVMLILPV